MPDELISFDEPTEPPKIRIICETCGSENVHRDAWACWDVETQDWVLEEGGVMDDAYCGECDGPTSLVEQPVAVLPEGNTP